MFAQATCACLHPHSFEVELALVRQLRGPHLSTCPWWSRRSSMALTAATSPSSFPVLDGTIGSEQRTSPLVASHDNLQQILGGGQRQFTHAEVIDDQQGHGSEGLHIFFPSTVDDG